MAGLSIYRLKEMLQASKVMVPLEMQSSQAKPSKQSLTTLLTGE